MVLRHFFDRPFAHMAYFWGKGFMKALIQTGALFALLAVVFGAFGAHYLAERLSETQLAGFKTGVQYQFYHALALLILAALYQVTELKQLKTAGRLFALGIILFSGSIYLLTTRDLTGLGGIGWLGPVTPIGGLCFIGGWAYLLYLSTKIK